ncbi:MAG TPA: BatD family protein [Flavobacteriaceae bacterium]|nr:BatD family protein [Flavobacteriaceae bacterium]
MKKLIFKYGLLGFYLLLSQFAIAQLEFTATTSNSKIGLNQRLRIEFSVDKQGADNFMLPNMSDFRIVAGPSQSVNQSWINGKVSFSQTYIYIIQPTKIGTFTIPSATVEYEGKIYKTNTLKITVTENVEVPKDPNDPTYMAQQGIHLVAEVSKENPYVGETLYVVYKLYVSENINVSNWAVLESPQYNGFWNQDIEIKGMSVQMGEYKGERYRYIELKKAILIPQKKGELVIEPMKMDITLGVPTGRYNFFGEAILRSFTESYTTGKKIIKVKALPIEGKPDNFTGAVGDFKFKVSKNKEILKANETAQIIVEVSGSGNFKLFEIPKLITPAELETYTPEYKENLQTTLNGINGRVFSNYTVVPQFKGKYKIPNVSFSYFNPSEKKYHIIESPDMFVEVVEGKDLPTSDSAFSRKQQVQVSGNSFRYIQTKTVFEPINKESFFLSKWFYLLLLLPLAVIPIGIIINRYNEDRSKDIVGSRKRKADKLAKKYLSTAKKELGKKESFYIALEKALHNFLKAKLSIETSEISQDKITEILLEKGLSKDSIEVLIAVLNDCDFARYTPSSNVKMKDEYEKAVEIIALIDKQL